MKYIKKFNALESIDIEFNTSVVKIDSDSIYFDNGIKLTHYHEQDCCEHHYLDFTHITLDDFDGLIFDLSSDDFFERIPDFGIALKPLNGFPVRIPGYGENNGYYSSNLSLILVGSLGEDIKVYDVSDCQVVSD
jgi:hypothetical protein